MNDPERVPEHIHEIPQYTELSNMLSHEAAQRAMLAEDEEMDDTLKKTILAGVDMLRERADKLAVSPELQDEIALLGARCMLGMAQEGVTEEAQEQLRTTLHEVKTYYETYGVLTGEAGRVMVEINNIGGLAVKGALLDQANAKIAAQVKAREKADKADQAARIESERVKEVNLAFRPHGVVVGNAEIKPYSNEDTLARMRKACLLLLAENPVDTLSVAEMLEEANIDASERDVPQDRTFSSIRDWMLSLKYKDEQLVVRHGHGVTSTYGWNATLKPNIIECDYSSQAEVDESFEAEPQVTASDVIDSIETQAIADCGQTQLETLQDEIEIIKGLRASSLFIMAHKWNSMDYILVDYGLPTINKELVGALQAYVPADLSKVKFLDAYRQQAYAEVTTLFEDKERLVELIEYLKDENDSITAEFIDFLNGVLGSDENRELVNRLIHSKKVTLRQFVGKDMRIEFSSVVLDESGEQLWPVPPDAAARVPKQIVKPITSSNASAAPTISEPAHTDQQKNDDMAALTPKQAALYAEYKMYGRNRVALGRRAQIKKVEDKAEELAKQFVNCFGVNSTPGIKAITSQFHGFERGIMAVKGNKNDRQHSREATYTLELFLRASLLSDDKLRNIIVARSNSNIFERVVARITAKVEAEASRNTAG